MGVRNVTLTFAQRSVGGAMADAGDRSDTTWTVSNVDDQDGTGFCGRFVVSSAAASGSERALNADPTEFTWESWGVPVGATVTGIQLTGFWEKLDTFTGSAPLTHGLNVHMVDAVGTPFAHLLAHIPPLVTGPWGAASGGALLSVPLDQQAWDAQIRLQLTYDFTDSLLPSPSFTSDYRLDAISLQIVYTDPPVPPGGGGGGGSPGTSWDLTPGGGLEPGLPPEGESLPYLSGANFRHEHSHCWVWEGRLFYMDANRCRTFVYDSETQGWADTGWGNVVQAYVLRNRFIESDLLMHVNTQGYFNPQTGQYNGRGDLIPTGFRLYFTNKYLGEVTTSPTRIVNNTLWDRIVEFRPLDGARDSMRSRLKRAHRFWVWGEQELDLGADPELVGYVTVTADTGRWERYPIVPWALKGYTEANPPRLHERGLLFCQEFTDNMVGRVFMPKIEFTQTRVTVRDAMLEYVVLD